MMGENKISVAMCTYNGALFLQEQLESISIQTLRPDEIIVCDDASSDNTAEILFAFKEKNDLNVQIIINDTNIGFIKNFEKSISLCSHDIIILADQDDIWNPDKIKKIIRVFEENPDAGYVFSNAQLIDEYGKALEKDLWHSITFNSSRYYSYMKGAQLNVMLKGGNFIYGATMSFRASYKNIILPITSTAFTCAHDTWISLILSSIGAYGVPLDDNLISYRQHKTQLSGGGIRRLPFPEKVRDIVKKAGDKDQELAMVLGLIIARLQSVVPVHKDFTHHSQKLLEEKILHLNARVSISSSHGIKRIKIILEETISGRYHKFSSSWKSIMKDLILTFFNFF